MRTRKAEHKIIPWRIYFAPRHIAYLDMLCGLLGFSRSGVVRAILDDYAETHGISRIECLVDKESIYSAEAYEDKDGA